MVLGRNELAFDSANCKVKGRPNERLWEGYFVPVLVRLGQFVMAWKPTLVRLVVGILTFRRDFSWNRASDRVHSFARFDCFNQRQRNNCSRATA